MELTDLKFTLADIDIILETVDIYPAIATKKKMLDLSLAVLKDETNRDDITKNTEKWVNDLSSKTKAARNIAIEDAAILKAKLIQLRRFIEMNNNVISAQDILNKKPE